MRLAAQYAHAGTQRLLGTIPDHGRVASSATRDLRCLGVCVGGALPQRRQIGGVSSEDDYGGDAASPCPTRPVRGARAP